MRGQREKGREECSRVRDAAALFSPFLPCQKDGGEKRMTQGAGHCCTFLAPPPLPGRLTSRFELRTSRIEGRRFLAFGGFLDAGATKINNPVVDYEVDEDLLGAGIGLEGLFDRSVQVRLYWGFALSDLDGRDTESGDNRVHFSATYEF